MGSRSEELRKKHRKVFFWSLVAAVGIHGAVFLLFPMLKPMPVTVPESETEPGRPVLARPVMVIALFGPPTITGVDGELWTEPPERVLEAQRHILLEGTCMALAREGEAALHGQVRLQVGWSGHTRVLGITESTGHVCADEVLVEVAGALRYHWLPDERFPAPLRLDQPVQLSEAEAQRR